MKVTSKLFTFGLRKHPLWRVRHPLLKVECERKRRKHLGFDPSLQPFTHIQIQTATKCNMACSFCPNSTLQREHGVMSETLFKKIIGDLAKLQFRGEVQLYLMNEPLLDSRLPRLVSYVKKKCRESRVTVASNLSVLTNNYMNLLFASGLDFLDGGDYSKVQAGVAPLGSYVFKRKVEAFRDYAAWKRRVHINCFPANTVRTNRSGLVQGVGLPLPLKLFCPRPFTRMYINYRGEALLCCNDWLFTEVMGNVRRNSVLQVWCNSKYRRRRLELLASLRTGICRWCDVVCG